MPRLTLAVALIALTPAAAFAHAHLKAATPAVDSNVRTPPTEVAIDFTEGVEPVFCTIEVVDAQGVHVDDGPAHTLPGDNKHLVVALKPVSSGTYTVRWHATAVDTHKTEGTYQFTVAGRVGG